MQHVTVSGELGSGKTAIAAALSARLGADVVSTGAIHRRIAAERGASALETNLIAERDASIDELIDGELVRLGAEPERIIFDSRMAWHFVPGALKIHLVVDPRVAAERMAGREATSVEGYRSVDEAQAKAAERQASERRRFLATYDVDIDRLRNYDVVVDTTNTGVEALADILEAIVADPDDLPPPPHLLLSARRLATSSDPDPDPGPDPGDGDGGGGNSAGARDGGAPHDGDDGDDAHDRGDPDDATATTDAVHVAYARPHLVVLAGHDLVAATVARGGDIVPGVLVAEGEEEVTPGRRARHVVAEDSAATSA